MDCYSPQKRRRQQFGSKCPVCDKVMGESEDLLAHVKVMHLEMPTCDKNGQPIGYHATCWCGCVFIGPSAALEFHMAGNGGIVAHYYDCVLGVRR